MSSQDSNNNNDYDGEEDIPSSQMRYEELENEDLPPRDEQIPERRPQLPSREQLEGCPLFKNRSPNNGAVPKTSCAAAAAVGQQKKDDVSRKRKNKEGGAADDADTAAGETKNSKKDAGGTRNNSSSKQEALVTEKTKILRKNLKKLSRRRDVGALDALTVQQLMDCGALQAELNNATGGGGGGGGGYLHPSSGGGGGGDGGDDDAETPSATSNSSDDSDDDDDEDEEEEETTRANNNNNNNNNSNAVDEFTRASGRSVTVNAGEVREPTMTNAVFNSLVAAQMEERKTTPWTHLKEKNLYRVDHVQRFESMYGPCWVGTLLPVKPNKPGRGRRALGKKVKMPRVFLPKGFVWKMKQRYMPGKACYFKTLGWSTITLQGGQGFGNRKR